MGWARSRTVAVVATPGEEMFETFIPITVFGNDRRDAGVPRYRVLVCAERPGPIPTNAGTAVVAPHGLDAFARAGTVIVPSWPEPTATPTPALLEALRQAHAHGGRIVGLCYGTFVLAAAGLLDGKRATTHWLALDLLKARHPAVDVDRDALYVDQGQILTSAGGSAGLDACLYLLARDHGVHTANTVARRLVVPPHRDGGQSQFATQPVASTNGDDAIGHVLAWAQANPHDTTVTDLARRAHASRRTFERQVRARTGQSPHRWLTDRRVRLAQELLERTDLPVEIIAQRCGLHSATNLRTHFHRLVGTTPTRYRHAFAHRTVE